MSTGSIGLSTGVIRRILNGENVSTPILQVLGCTKLTRTGNNRFRLLISDGMFIFPFAMLGSHLSHMITNKTIEKFTIIRVDKCVCNQVQPERKVIILLNLTVLMPGNEVNKMLGNPIDSSTTPSAAPNENGVARGYQIYDTSLSGESPSSVHPINSLMPYQDKWTIKARVTSKNFRMYSNSYGERKAFSVSLLDESGEIKATGSNDASEKYFNMLEPNKIYYISRATLKLASAKFSTVRNPYEITFNNDTMISLCDEEATSIPMLHYSFVPIAQIQEVEKDSYIDVMGICKTFSDLQTFVAYTSNKEISRRDLKLVDRSNKEVSLTLWGKAAETFNGSTNPVIVVKGARVSDFYRKSLSVSMSSAMYVNPDIKKAHILKGWFEREGCNMESLSISSRRPAVDGGQWKTFALAVREQVCSGDRPDYFINKATVVMLKKENCVLYMACPDDECNKKVIEVNNGIYRCDKCNREYPGFKWHLILSLEVSDFTENRRVTCFTQAAETILGVNAQELGAYKESDDAKYNEVLTNANFKSCIFKLRTKMETFNEENYLKTTVLSLTPVEPISYIKKLLSDIKQMEKCI